MISAGLDAGSRTIVLVTLDDDKIDFKIIDAGVNPLQRCQQILAGKDYERMVVTGYGRYLVAQHSGDETVSEIKAYATGARHLYPDCRTVIDIGGQDSKVLRLSDYGSVLKFEMNDRCAAGTGKFLEVMARTLDVGIESLGDLALSTSRSVQINSLCTVFADSEVVSLIARGEAGSAIARGLHEAIASRIVNMVRRVGVEERVVLAGGGALNKCLHHLLNQTLGVAITVPPEPQIVGALGAALLAEWGVSRNVETGGQGDIGAELREAPSEKSPGVRI